MRSLKKNPFLIALSCALALVTFACDRGEEPDENEPEIAEESLPAEQPPYEAEESEPELNDLQTQPRSVVVEEAEPSSEGRVDDSELEAREQRLAERQAELEARERRLREQERRPEPRVQPRRETPREPERERVAESRPADREEAPAPATTDDEVVEPQRRAEPEREPEPEPEREVELEPEREAEPEPEPEIEEEPRPEPATVPAGTVLEVEFLDSVSSQSSRPGDSFRTRIASDIREDGRVVIPRGSEIVGEVTEATPLRKVGGRARLALKFTDLVLPSGQSLPIEASLVEQGRSETGRDAATIGGGAAGGAILGRILNRKDRSKGAIIGAVIGAAAGAVLASRTPGEEVTIPEGTMVNVELNDSVRVRPRR
ncbi:MAG TPA: glycine zipper domain-containing protein [Thermoanaerobaculia bacterium]